ncbi:MAG TPA: hypothetical protein VF502_06545 [Stellaceae bacterium]
MSTHGQVIVTEPPTAHIQAPPRVPFHHRRSFARSFDPFSPFGFFQPVPSFLLGGVLDSVAGTDALAPAGTRAPMVMVAPDASDPPRAIRSAVDERPSVETTPEGVVIVRGPGSRHLQR